MALLVISWLIAIFGLCVSAYLLFFKYNDTRALLSSFLILLGFLLLAGISRMLANIGQVLFEAKEMAYVNLQTLIERITALEQSSGELLQEQICAVGQLSNIVSQDLLSLNKEFNLLSRISEETREVLKERLEMVRREIESLCDNLNKRLAHSSTEEREGLKEVYNSLQALKDSLERVGCDSKDISQNIHQIKSFFEQIEKKLDLKK